MGRDGHPRRPRQDDPVRVCRRGDPARGHLDRRGQAVLPQRPQRPATRRPPVHHRGTHERRLAEGVQRRPGVLELRPAAGSERDAGVRDALGGGEGRGGRQLRRAPHPADQVPAGDRLHRGRCTARRHRPARSDRRRPPGHDGVRSIRRGSERDVRGRRRSAGHQPGVQRPRSVARLLGQTPRPPRATRAGSISAASYIVITGTCAATSTSGSRTGRRAKRSRPRPRPSRSSRRSPGRAPTSAN